SERELKHIETDDQAIQTILLGFLEDIYAAVDSCETAQEIWLRVQQMMKVFNLVMSESEHSTVSYTSISLNSDPSTWGIPIMNVDEVLEMDPYEEVSQQGQAAPPSPAYTPDPLELEDHVPVYVLEPEEDPIDYATDDDEDEEEESSKDDNEEEENLTLADSTVVAFPTVDLVPSVEETMPFETEVARLLSLPTPPPSPLTLLSSPLPQIPSTPLHIPSPPITSPTYTEPALGYRVAGIWLRAASPLTISIPSISRKADIPKADIPPWKMQLLTTPTPWFEVEESSVAATTRQPRSTMPYWAIEMVDIKVSYQARVRRQESEESYTRHQDAQRDHAALRGELDTLRMYLSSLCTTHEQERVEARQALARSEAYNRDLKAWIIVLDTRAHSHEWQRQDADDHATRHIMRIQELEAGARVDTLEDTGSSAFKPWKTLMKMMTAKYCPRNKIKKLEIEIWSLKVKVKESDVVKKYMGGLPNMIQGTVMSTKPKIMEEAVEMANNLMDQKLYTLAGIRLRTKGSKIKTLKTTIINNNKARGITLEEHTLLGPVRKRSMVDLCQNVPSATTTIMVRVH
nr:hypothetical protein [Tanacetum cinerariifolium]